MIVNEWEPYFTENYGHQFPDTYLCIDTEYTGGDEREDLITEIGHVMVQNNVVVDRMNIVLNWFSYKEISREFVQYKLDNIRAIMGEDWRLTRDVMQSEGIHPTKAFRFYYELFKTWHERELPFVAHNGRKAEERMLRGNFNRFINKPFFMHQNALWDTGALFKATRLYESEDILHSSVKYLSIPERADTLKSYFERVLNCRAKGLHWNLKHCLTHYNLLDKLESKHKFHRAEDDAYCSHLLMQKYSSQVIEAVEPSHVEAVEAAFDVDVSPPKPKPVPVNKVEVSIDSETGLERLLEDAPRQPLADYDVTDVFVPAEPVIIQPEPVEEVEEDKSSIVLEKVEAPPVEDIKPPVAPRPQPTRSRKRGQRVI